MADTPEAPAEAPQTPESVKTPTNTNTEQAPQQQAPNMYGFTSEQLAEMRKFYDNNGGFEKVKSKISNPEKFVEPKTENKEEVKVPTSHTQPEEPVAQTPQGAITVSEFLAEQYFKSLAGEEKYKNISNEIRDGSYLKEMAAFGIQALNQDGSINDKKVRMYLDLKAQTVPAKPTETTPSASSAPTVDYVSVGDKIDSIDQAYKVIMQPGHPAMEKAEAYIKEHFSNKK